MRIKVLGCYGTEFLQFKSCGFLIDRSVMLDAGTIVSALDLEGQREIRDIFITHPHLDHTKDLFFLANNLFEETARRVKIFSTERILKELKRHFFNGVICPDFTAIPKKESSVISLGAIKPGEFHSLPQGLSFRAERVAHKPEAVGYIIRCDHGHVVYTGDTGPTEHIWKVCNTLENMLAVFIECSFPNELQELALLSGHLTPRSMVDELEKLNKKDYPVFVCQMKPQYLKTIEKEISALHDERISVLTQGEELDL